MSCGLLKCNFGLVFYQSKHLLIKDFSLVKFLISAVTRLWFGNLFGLLYPSVVLE